MKFEKGHFPIGNKCKKCGTMWDGTFSKKDIGKEMKCPNCGEPQFTITEKMYNEAAKSSKSLTESILDPIQSVRCDALFNPNDKSEQPVMLKTATDFILGLLQRFKEDTGLDFEYTEVFMVGSSLGFQYKDTTDIDVDARISLPREALMGKFHLIPKNIPLPGTAHPVNIFLMTTDDPEFDFENNCENKIL